jgi:uncharacterized protein YbjT (DUF2867 family)
MKEKTAAIIGSTGLIGSKLLELLLNDKYYSMIRVIVRRPVEFDNPAVIVKVIDFSDDESFKSTIAGSDALFCAVGTTQKKVKGDSAAYYKVDYDIPVKAAKFCEETGCPSFLTVSSVGAGIKSKNFYLRLKGEVEDKIRGMEIASVSVFRPSMLLGKRKEFRFGEEVAKAISEPLSFLFPSKFKPVKAEIVARAMIAASKKAMPGFNVYHYNEMINLANL